MAREVRLHARLQHRNILALYAAFEDNEGINLVLVRSVCSLPLALHAPCMQPMMSHMLSLAVQEFAAGRSLYHVLGQAGGYLPEERVAARIMPALVSAVAHMHAQVAPRAPRLRSLLPKTSWRCC